MSSSRLGCLRNLAIVLPIAAAGGCATLRPSQQSHEVAFRFHMDRIVARDSTAGLALAPDHACANCEMDFADPKSILVAALQAAPENSVIFPSERYFYFETTIGSRQVSGNLRFTDADKGVLHIGYFDRFDGEARRGGSFGSSEDVHVTPGPAAETWTVRVGGISRGFRLDQRYRTAVDRVSLLPDECFVSGVFDESGVVFALLFHAPTASLYYVLVDDSSLERRVPLPKNGAATFEVGLASRFVYYVDHQTDRRILVGVHAANVRDNNYFDGPFDQVPPDLALRDLLHASYPYTKFGGGIDEHGNFNSQEGQRVAITPYQQYRSIDELSERIGGAADQRADGPRRWVALVYESKRNFHEEVEASLVANLKDYPAAADTLPPYRHDASLSRSWPANHFLYTSRIWVSESHDTPHSSGWPANHDIHKSGNGRLSTERP